LIELIGQKKMQALLNYIYRLLIGWRQIWLQACSWL